MSFHKVCILWSLTLLYSIAELEELKVLKKSNSRRDDRLARVRTKNLRSKEATAEREYADTRNLAVSQMVELQVRTYHLYNYV